MISRAVSTTAVAAIVHLWPGIAHAAPVPTWAYESNVDSAYVGCPIAPAGDVNGDGFADFLAGGSPGPRLFFGSLMGPFSASPAVITGYGPGATGAGDVNADGYMDVAVWRASTPTTTGALRVLSGDPGGLLSMPLSTLNGPADSSAWGNQVVGAADVNGDGYSDLAISSPTFGGGLKYGRVQLYAGSLAGLALSPLWSYAGSTTVRNVGNDLCSAGDFNGDAYADLAVTCTLGTDPGMGKRALLIFTGSPSGLSTSPTWIDSVNVQEDGVGGPGDVNGDGYSDIWSGTGFSTFGTTHVLLGSSTGPTKWDILAGHSGTVAGDVNGDGYADFVAIRVPIDCGQGCGSPACAGLPCGNLPATKSLIYGGPGNFWTAENGYTLPGGINPGESGVGDVNGDGFDDFAIPNCSYSNGQAVEGLINVYAGKGRRIANGSPSASATSPRFANSFGFSVARIGDMNGDGFDDVAVGAPGDGLTHAGRVFVYFGSTSGLAASPAFTVGGNISGERFGTSVSGAGDLNGDGYDDLIIGAPFYTNGEFEEGTVAILYGSAIADSIPDLWIESNQAFASFGTSVSGAGDVNGDGYADVIVGAPYFDSGAGDEGRAFVYAGSGTGLLTSPVWTTDGSRSGASLGWSVSGAGDIDHDGYSEVVVGEPGMGRAPVFHGSSAGPATMATPTLVGTDDFGYSVAAAGDVNGDGYGDVIVGTPQLGNSSGPGHVDVFRGGPDCLDNIPIWSADGTSAGEHIGATVAGVGDLDDDGFSDVAQSVPANIRPGGEAGYYSGSPTWLAAQPTGSIFGHGGSGLTGADMNADGFTDLIIGAPGQSELDSSRIYSYCGNQYSGRTRLVRQLRSSASAPIALLGRATSTSLRLRERGFTAAGRARVRLQWQASSSQAGWGPVHEGPVLDSGSIQQGSGSIAPFDELIDLAQTNTLFSWRVRVSDKQLAYGGSPWFSMQGNGPHQSDLRTGTILAGALGPQASSRTVQALQPNPSSHGIAMRLNVVAGTPLEVTLMDVQGRTVRRVFSGVAAGGIQQLTWDGLNDHGRPLAQGVYLLYVRAGNRTESEKITVLR